MSCLNPLIALWSVNKDGVKCPKILGRITENTPLEWFRKTYGDNLILLPCNKCVGCKKDYSRNWQARIICEASTSINSYFITLTYRDNPPLRPLKSDLRYFVKSIRNRYGSGVKFFGCGEVGSNTERSHYHIILFNVPISDLNIISKRGVNYLYASKEIEKLWSKGFITVGSVDVESAGYVARYCQKKRVSNNGEFCIMSRGLGLDYIKLHINDLLKSDYLYFKGERFKLPRYFLDKYYQLSNDLDSLLDYKKRKCLAARVFTYNVNTSMIENEARKSLLDIKNNESLRKEVLGRDLS